MIVLYLTLKQLISGWANSIYLCSYTELVEMFLTFLNAKFTSRW